MGNPIKKRPGEDAAWKKCVGYLREAMSLAGLSGRKFKELADEAALEVGVNAASNGASCAEKLHTLLDVLCEDGSLAYLDWKATCEDVAAVLSGSAAPQDLPPIPEGVLEEHPMQEDPHSATGYSEMFGGMAAVYIAPKMPCWNILLIDIGTDGHYACVVPPGKAEAFIAKIKDCFAAIGFAGSISLLPDEEKNRGAEAKTMTIIGIDLGTTNSLGSIWRDTGVELIPNALGEVLTPSVVSVDEDGTLLVGQAARERLVSAPEKTAAEFKRFMGTEKKYYLGANTYTPEDLSSFVLRKLKEDAESYLARNYPGETITEAIVSVPAYFNDNQRAATKRAGYLAGLNVERILNEPSAAALACRMYDREADFTALVFDFGGGTLDVSLVDCFANMVSVLAVSGDNRLGGADFDQQIALEYCAANKLRFERLSPSAQGSLRYHAELAKRRLTTENTATITIPDGEAAGTMELTNQKLVDICAPLFQRLSVPLRRVLVDSGKSLQDITRLILVGGSCKMPIVQDYLRQLLQRALENPFSPDTVVGLGAGVYAGIRERRESIRDIVMTDLCPFTLGTSVRNRTNPGLPLFDPIIERNSILPCSRVVRHCTTTNFQTKVKVDVLQGEGRYCKDNLKLGEFTVAVPSAPAGKEQVDIRFTYDINGILEVEVTIVSTGQVYRELIMGKNNSLTAEEVNKRLKELSQLKLPPQDREELRVLIARGERLYAQSTGGERESIGERLEYFIAIAEQQAPTELARHIASFTAFLEGMEKSVLGLGLFPSDNLGADEEEASEDDLPASSLLHGNSADGDSNPPVQ